MGNVVIGWSAAATVVMRDSAVASSSAHPPHQELGSKSPASPSADECVEERQTDRDTQSSLDPSRIPVVLGVSTSSPWTR